MLLYLTLVVAVAAIGGLWPAVRSAIGCRPGHQLVLHPSDPHLDDRGAGERPRDRACSSSSASVVSVLVDRAARARAEAQRGRAEAEALARLAGWLAAEDDPLPTLLEPAPDTFGLDGGPVLRPDGRRAGRWRPPPARSRRRSPTEGSRLDRARRRSRPRAAWRPPARGVTTRAHRVRGQHVGRGPRLETCSEEAAEAAELAAVRRTSHRDPAGRLARSADAARLHQGGRQQPPAGRRGVEPTRARRVPRHDRGGDRPAQRAWWGTCWT